MRDASQSLAGWVSFGAPVFLKVISFPPRSALDCGDCEVAFKVNLVLPNMRIINQWFHKEPRTASRAESLGLWSAAAIRGRDDSIALERGHTMVQHDYVLLEG